MPNALRWFLAQGLTSFTPWHFIRTPDDTAFAANAFRREDVSEGEMFVFANAAYRKLMGSLKGERKKQLLEAQRLWGKYTEANCAFYYDLDGGTMARMQAAECGLTARVERAAELEDLTK